MCSDLRTLTLHLSLYFTRKPCNTNGMLEIKSPCGVRAARYWITLRNNGPVSWPIITSLDGKFLFENSKSPSKKTDGLTVQPTKLWSLIQ